MSNIIYGCGTVLPFWDTEVDEFEPKRLVESVTDLRPLKYVTTPRPVTLTLRGKNVRQEIAKVTFQLQVCFSAVLWPSALPYWAQLFSC